MTENSLLRRVVAEFIGSTFLLAAIVGSGIMAERLAGGNSAIALLGNSVAVGAALVAFISTFGGISGAHFNPAVTVSDAICGGLVWRDVPFYIIAQTAGAFLGVGVANLMFDLPVFFASQKIRAGGSQLLSEFVATFGLLAVIWGCVRLSLGGRAVYGRGVYRRGVLVYGVNFICKSGGNSGAFDERYFRRYSPG